MTKDSKCKIIVSLAAILLPAAAGLVIWQELPQEMPVHWNMAGEIDGTASKAVAVFGLTGIMFLAQLIMAFGISKDPKSGNINRKIANFIYLIIPVLNIIVMSIIYSTALGYETDAVKIVQMLIGIILLIIGNWLPKCQPSYTVGIRLPWTLDDDNNWRNTHRMAGPLWMAGGFAIMMSSFAGRPGVIIMIIAFAAMIIIPVIYSYRYYEKHKEI